jgi:mannosyltransferase OCH1-like enzyme
MAYVSQAQTIQQLDDEIAALSAQIQTGFPFPKILHQVWINDDPRIPEKWIESHTEWKRLHPQWFYVLWSRDMARELVEKYEPNFLECYDQYPYEIQRIDAVRYCFLKRYGGLYVDLDLVPLENIEPYLMDSCEAYFVNSANIKSCYTNSIMASKKGSDIWDKVIEEIQKPGKWWAYGKHTTVMTTTGPVMLTDVISNYSKTICRLPWTKFNRDGIDDIGINQTSNHGIVLKNLEGGTWHDIDSHLYNFIFRARYLIVVLLIVIICVIIYMAIKYWQGYKRCRATCSVPNGVSDPI